MNSDGASKSRSPGREAGAWLDGRGRKSPEHDDVACGVTAVKVVSGYSRNCLALLCCLSLLIHTMAVLAVTRLGPMVFAGPVMAGQIIDVELKEPMVSGAEAGPVVAQQPEALPSVSPAAEHGGATLRASADPFERLGEADEHGEFQRPTLSDDIDNDAGKEADAQMATDEVPFPPANGISHEGVASLPPPIRHASEFFGTKHEKLSYQITMYGVPVGNALLEATNKNGELRITTKVKSNSAISLIYPVDNTTETRVIGGRFIMTTIKRHEGNDRTDVGYTLCLGEKNVFWADRMRRRYYNTTVPTDQVLDMITGFYFLRNQELEVGKNVTLHLFDNNTYSPVQVLVLRKERLVLSNLKVVDAIVVQPQLTTSGIFNRTGDLLIWLTADASRVPVKLETTIPLGRVTADLVSSESE